jgi:hypothetical protein
MYDKYYVSNLASSFFSSQEIIRWDKPAGLSDEREGEEACPELDVSDLMCNMYV